MSYSSPPVKIVFLDRATLSPHTVLKPFAFPHALRTFERTAASEVAERIRDADIVITNKVRLDAAALAAAQRLRLVAIRGEDHGGIACRGLRVDRITRVGERLQDVDAAQACGVEPRVVVAAQVGLRDVVRDGRGRRGVRACGEERHARECEQAEEGGSESMVHQRCAPRVAARRIHAGWCAKAAPQPSHGRVDQFSTSLSASDFTRAGSACVARARRVP